MAGQYFATRLVVVLLGCAIFSMATLAVLAFQDRTPIKCQLTLSELDLASVTGSELKGFEELEGIKDTKCFVVKCQEREIAAFTLNSKGEIASLILTSSREGRIAQVSRSDDEFPGRVSIRFGKPTIGLMPPFEIIDLDFDGIPDVKLDFEKKTCNKLKTLIWGEEEPIGNCRLQLSNK